MMKKLLTLSLLLASFVIDAAEDHDQEAQDRDDRTLYESNRMRLRRAKSDRFRSFNYGNYAYPEAQEHGENETDRPR